MDTGKAEMDGEKHMKTKLPLCVHVPFLCLASPPDLLMPTIFSAPKYAGHEEDKPVLTEDN